MFGSVIRLMATIIPMLLLFVAAIINAVEIGIMLYKIHVEHSTGELTEQEHMREFTQAFCFMFLDVIGATILLSILIASHTPII